MRVSIGVMAYNEEANLEALLNALNSQTQNVIKIIEIFVVASGCTDGTVPIAKKYSQKDSRVKLIEQEQREGKASAINLFIEQATGDILILESADTLPLKNTCEELLRSFLDPEVGMTGAHPLPLNNPHNFIGYAAHFLWGLHHKLAQHEPKLGEMVAFRNIVPQIPVDTAVDEASIEALIREQGLKLKYVPDALVFNKGPDTVCDFMKQRRRIASGHLHLKQNQGYETSTLGTSLIQQVLKEEFLAKVQRLKRLIKRKRYQWLKLCLAGYSKKGIWAVGVIGLEIWARVQGSYDFYFAKRNPVVWDIAGTTKKLLR